MASKPIKVVVGPSRSDSYKLYLVSSIIGKPLAVVPLQGFGAPVFKFPVASSDSATFIGANSICRYLWLSTKGEKEDSSEKWLAMEEKISNFTYDLSHSKAGEVLSAIEKGIKDEEISATNLSLSSICLIGTLISSFETNFNNIILVQKSFPNCFNLVKTFRNTNSKECQTAITKANSMLFKLYPNSLVETFPLSQNAAPQILFLNRIVSAAVVEAFPFISEKIEVSLEEGRVVVDTKSKNKKNAASQTEPEPPELQLSVALKIFGLLKSIEDATAQAYYSSFLKGPKYIADHIVSVLSTNCFLGQIVDKYSVAGPGFINISLKTVVGIRQVNNILEANTAKRDFAKLENMTSTANYTLSPSPSSYFTDKRYRIGIDMSSPNVAKEMHVGHLRATIVGEILSRILAFKGHKISKINHIGDWGTQFGMLLTFITDSNTAVLPGQTSLSELNAIYKAAKTRFDEDEDFKTRSRARVVALQQGDPESRDIWERLIAISESGFNDVYKRLDVSFPDGYCGESFYQSRIPEVIKEIETKGFLEEFEGAKIVKTSVHKVPLFIQKSDGGFGYDSTDMAALKYRISELNLDRILYCVDAGQANHFYSCFELGDKLGWLAKFKDVPENGPHHVGFGLVCGSDGKRFRSRSGETVTLKALLDEAKFRVKRELEQRVEKGETSLLSSEIDEAAAKIGYSALKYFDLKNSREKDYIFDYDQMLQPMGNTGVYIIYTYARLCSIERKLEGDLMLSISDIINRKTKQGLLLEKNRRKEWEIVRTILKLGDTMESVETTLCPHILCTFVYDLCVAVSKFYNEHQLIVKRANESERILDPEHGEDWVCLLRAARVVLRDTAPLLGVDLLERI